MHIENPSSIRLSSSQFTSEFRSTGRATEQESFPRLLCLVAVFIVSLTSMMAVVCAGPSRSHVRHDSSRGVAGSGLLSSRHRCSVDSLPSMRALPSRARAETVQILGERRLLRGKKGARTLGNETFQDLPVVFAQAERPVPFDPLSTAPGPAAAQKAGTVAASELGAVGAADFVRLSAKLEANGVLRLQANRSVAAEVQQEGARVVLQFGKTRIEFSGLTGSQMPSWIRSMAMGQPETANQLVIELAGGVGSARISHLASQNATIVEPIYQDNPKTGDGSPAQPASWKWKHITVDAGHGGLDRGTAIREQVYEKDVTLAIARKLRWALETRLGVTVVLSRPDDRTQSLEERVTAANLARSNLLISIHIGSSAPSKVAHSYAYTAAWPGEGSAAAEAGTMQRLFVPWHEAQRGSLTWSQRLAGSVQAELNRALNDGQALNIRHIPAKLLRALAMPAVLVELGNAREAGFQSAVQEESFQNLAAATLASAVEKFRTLHERP